MQDVKPLRSGVKCCCKRVEHLESRNLDGSPRDSVENMDMMRVGSSLRAATHTVRGGF
jgi:hypothetical protein